LLLEYLIQTHSVGEGLVIEAQALSPAGLALLGRLITQEMRIMEEAAIRDAAEEQAYACLLGEDCPPLQRRLFECLCDGNLFWTPASGRSRLTYGPITLWLRSLRALKEHEAAEVVYQVEWSELTDPQRGRLRARLRKLQQALGNRLAQRKIPFRIVRPRGAWLFLWEHADPSALEEERERLWSAASERLTEGELLARLTAATAALGDSVRRGAARAAASGGVSDPGLIRAAVDAALLAAHQHALAVVAGADEAHYFRHKFELFAAGRWPLGVHSGRYVVF
jgi:hypothetical protein